MKLEKRHLEILKEHIPNFSIWYVLTVNGIDPSDDVDPKQQNVCVYYAVIENKFFKCVLIYDRNGWKNSQQLTFCSGKANSFVDAFNQCLIKFAGYIKNENENEV